MLNFESASLGLLTTQAHKYTRWQGDTYIFIIKYKSICKDNMNGLTNHILILRLIVKHPEPINFSYICSFKKFLVKKYLVLGTTIHWASCYVNGKVKRYYGCKVAQKILKTWVIEISCCGCMNEVAFYVLKDVTFFKNWNKALFVWLFACVCVCVCVCMWVCAHTFAGV